MKHGLEHRPWSSALSEQGLGQQAFLTASASCSMQEAHEKVDLWKEREIQELKVALDIASDEDSLPTHDQDKGSRCTISLKSRRGDVVCTLALV